MAKKIGDLAKIKCAFCRGKGLDPFELLSKMAKCQVCGGRGEVWVAEPYRRCAHCGGSGVNPHSRISCSVCLGRGVITTEKTKTCLDCKGTGKNFESGLPCLTCGGGGVV